MAGLRENIQVQVEINGNKALSTLADLDAEAKELRGQLKGMAKGTDEYIAKTKELDEIKDKQEKLRKEIGLTALPLKDLAKKSAQLKNELKQLTPGTDEFIRKSKELTAVNDRMRTLNNEIRNTRDESKKMTNEWQSFVPFSGEVSQLANTFQGLKGVVMSAKTSFGLLRGAIISTGIGALIIALTAVYGWFTRTKKGVEQLNIIMAAMGAFTDAIFESMNQLISFLASKAVPTFNSIYSVFSDILSFDWERMKKGASKALSGLSDLFMDFINEFVTISVGFGKILEGVFTLNYAKLKEGVSEMALDKVFNYASEAAKSLGDNISEDVKLAMQLAERMNRLVEAENLESLANAKRKKEIQELIFLTRDSTKSFEEREAALIKANEIEQEGLKRQLALQRERAAIAWADDARADSTEEDTQKAREESIKLVNLETQSLARQRELLNRLNELRNKMAAEEKKAAQERAKEAKERLKIEQQLADLEISLIQDQFDQKEAQIKESYQRQIEAITEGEYLATERKKLLEEARDRELQELKWARRQEFLGEEAIFEEEEALLAEEKFQNDLITQQERDQLLYELKRAALERQLALVQEMHGRESAEAQKVKNSIFKVDLDYQKKTKENLLRAEEANNKLYDNNLSSAQSTFESLSNILSSDEEMRKKHFRKIQTMQAAAAIIDGIKEVTSIWKNSAEFGPMGYIWGAIQTGVAIGRTAMNVSKINNAKYGDGGLLLSGPSHASGGMPILNPSTGQIVAEVEGGEPILSKATYANNKPIVDQLLYSSMYRNGAAVFEDGGTLPTMENQGSDGAPLSNQEVTSKTDTLLVELITEVRRNTEAVMTQKSIMKAYVTYSDIESVQDRINEDKLEAQV
ncbi:sbcc family protein [Flammeovirga aprica]|uniref:Phage tail tape measure protein n=1 Tax=Flammeovirga aprica JL-4 TaxID=694437 RepID=A0A7X9P0X3_9BACT|nr:hypothetical protein [Flammeovirga aprica]NME67198.1 hypothetical protein [Flammeovirga aprica JL-4]